MLSVALGTAASVETASALGAVTDGAGGGEQRKPTDEHDKTKSCCKNEVFVLVVHLVLPPTMNVSSLRSTECGAKGQGDYT